VAQPRTNSPEHRTRTLTIGDAEPRNRPRQLQATAKPRCDPSSRITHPQRHTTAGETTRHARQRCSQCRDMTSTPHATAPKAPLPSGRGVGVRGNARRKLTTPTASTSVTTRRSYDSPRAEAPTSTHEHCGQGSTATSKNRPSTVASSSTSRTSERQSMHSSSATMPTGVCKKLGFHTPLEAHQAALRQEAAR